MLHFTAAATAAAGFVGLLQYHAGYRAQVRRWPLNPLDCVAAWLSKRPKEWM